VTDRLVLFGVTGLEKVDVNTGWGTWVRAAGGDHVLASSGLSFHDSEGRLIAVLSHRKDDGRLPRLRSDAAADTYYALLRSRGEPTKGPRWPDGWGSADVPPVEWEPTTIAVDGTPTDFEVGHFDNGYWAAIGRALEADITLTSFGVPLKGLQLERVDEGVKRRLRPPPAVLKRFPTS
jgi:hypothetical protein